MRHVQLNMGRFVHILQSENRAEADKGTWSFFVFNKQQKLRSYCLIVSLLHLVLAIIYLGVLIQQETKPGSLIIKRLQTHTTQSIGAWLSPSATTNVNTTGLANLLDLRKCPIASSIPARGSEYVIQQTVLAGVGEIDTRLLLIAFHLLSWLFQFVSAYDDRYYEEMEAGKTNLGHFFEYSVSAPLMLIAICVQLGITDIYLITSIAANCSACMLFGAVAEMLSSTELLFVFRFPLPRIDFTFSAHWVAHFAGWITIVIAYVCASSNLIIFDRCISPDATARMPESIRIVLVIEGLLFMSFGFVQVYAFIARKSVDRAHKETDQFMEKKRNIAYRTETAYILLSFVAKTILGGFILLGNSTFDN